MTNLTESAESMIFDHNDPSVPSDEVRAQYAELVAKCPVAHSDQHGGFDVLSGYGVARETATDGSAFISGDGVLIPASGLPRIPALEYDGEEHLIWRGLLEELVTPEAVRGLEPLITEIVNAQIDTFAGQGTADLAAVFAEPIPAIVIGGLVGLNAEESLRSRELATAAFGAIGTDTFLEQMTAFQDYTLERLEERRAAPRNDFLSELATGHYKGLRIDDDTAMQIFVALLMGGHHSTAAGISGLVRDALQDDQTRDSLAGNPKAITRAMEESLRLTTPLQLFARTAVERCTVGGVDIEQGNRVLINYAAANRDPEEFDNPDEFDPSRRRNRHLAFGAGPHRCVGQHLARAEMRIALHELLRRLPDVHLDGPVQTSGLIGGVLMTTVSLPVAFTPED